MGEKFMDKNYKLKKIKDKIYILFFLLVCVILLSINLFWTKIRNLSRGM